MKEIFVMEDSLYMQSNLIICMYIAYILKYVSDFFKNTSVHLMLLPSLKALRLFLSG